MKAGALLLWAIIGIALHAFVLTEARLWNAGGAYLMFASAAISGPLYVVPIYIKRDFIFRFRR